jgi:hypothetical protein
MVDVTLQIVVEIDDDKNISGLHAPRTNGATAQTYTRENNEAYKYLICRMQYPQKSHVLMRPITQQKISTQYSAGLV